MKSKLLICSLFFSLMCSAQGEANFWYFGSKAGLDFNSGSPVVRTDGQLQTFEGLASISDSAGNLLFYTDGITIYSKNHTVMLNGTGLFGDPSTTQSATIVPRPGSTTIYYVFSIDAEAKPNGLSYSIVDLSLNGGLGAVTVKNTFINSPVCEKIAIIKNDDETGFWILTHLWNSNSFQARLLTSTGISAPVTTNIGTIVTGATIVPPGVPSPENTLGYMKFSPDGTKVAICNYGESGFSIGNLELFDFNNATGVLSNAQSLMTNQYGLYGLEFSPNGKLLYATINRYGKLYQFDLTSANIPASRRTLLDSPTKARIGALQLAPDGKIYISTSLDPFLGIINNPNGLDTSCGLIMNGLNLGTISYLGLPAFNQSIFFKPTIFFKNTCLVDTTEFELVSNQKITSVTWDFGDGTPPQTILNNNKITHNYPSSAGGIYTVTATNITGMYATKPAPDLTAQVEIFQTTATKPTNNSAVLVCDTNNNGLFRFDLTANNSQILNGQNPAKYSIRYFENATRYASNVSIFDPTKYTNTTAYSAQTIYAEVTNLDNPVCKALTTFDIDVFDSPASPPTAVSKISKCDDTSVGTNMDGFVLFDLTQKTAELLSTQVPKPLTVYLVEYYADSALANLIVNPIAYPNTSKIQTIYAKIFNQENLNCYVQASFSIEVLDIPVVSNTKLDLCDLDSDGFTVFNLTDANPQITSSFATLKFEYFESLADAQSGTNPILNFTAYSNKTIFTDNQIFAKVSNSICFAISQITINANIAPAAPAVLTPIIYCKDEKPLALSATGTNLLWYTSATGDIGTATAPIPNTSIVGQTAYYVSQSNTCEGPRAAINVIVGAIPTTTLPSKTSLCIDSTTGALIAPYIIDTGLSMANCSFQWYTINSGSPTLIIGETNSKYTTSAIGIFGVVITDLITKCASEIFTTEVIESFPPISMEVLVPEYFTDHINLTIEVTPKGNYEYKIDDGPFQESNTFYNVSSGNQTIITVRDLNNCGEISKEVVLINYPKFFTPNADGFNDIWNIVDLQDQKESKIQIFDRYGKLIKQIKPSGQGWDGTYNGAPLPATDYWFMVDYLDKNNTLRQFKSHFALKR
jgi:gliding motility-associated-like protein